ncbi:helix-turn-helix transcriptional regulator [Streptomyces sp. NPDC054949]
MTLGAAVHAREVLRFDYPAATAPGADEGRRDADRTAPPPRRAQPHHLVTWGGRWYLVAWDLDREDWRTFRADRIGPRVPTGPASFRARCPGVMWPPTWPAGSTAPTPPGTGPAEAR